MKEHDSGVVEEDSLFFHTFYILFSPCLSFFLLPRYYHYTLYSWEGAREKEFMTTTFRVLVYKHVRISAKGREGRKKKEKEKQGRERYNTRKI